VVCPTTDIEQMVKDAEAHADEDKKRKQLVEAKNQGEALIHSTEKSITELWRQGFRRLTSPPSKAPLAI
jgi:molecular chaperone DnaK (HSP70)